MQPENFWGINTNMEKIYIKDVSEFEEGIKFSQDDSDLYWEIISINNGIAHLRTYKKETDKHVTSLNWPVNTRSDFYFYGEVKPKEKYYRIINKIHQIDKRRKELGYAF
jgi:hypothetical protein